MWNECQNLFLTEAPQCLMSCYFHISTCTYIKFAYPQVLRCIGARYFHNRRAKHRLVLFCCCAFFVGELWHSWLANAPLAAKPHTRTFCHGIALALCAIRRQLDWWMRMTFPHGNRCIDLMDAKWSLVYLAGPSFKLQLVWGSSTVAPLPTSCPMHRPLSLGLGAPVCVVPNHKLYAALNPNKYKETTAFT